LKEVNRENATHFFRELIIMGFLVESYVQLKKRIFQKRLRVLPKRQNPIIGSTYINTKWHDLHDAGKSALT
jgi:hypothetical protein